jgi:hypothetical protein
LRCRIIPPWTGPLLESLASSQPSDLLGRSCLPWSFRHSPTASPSEPHQGRPVQRHPSSTLRLSQPLSGFPASSSSTALFRAAAVPECLPSERSPRRDREPLSKSHAPSRLSTGVPNEPPSRPFATDFSRLPRLDAVAWLPPSAMNSLSAGCPASRSLWASNGFRRPYPQLHPPRSFDPPANPFTPIRVAPHWWSLLSWFCPSRVPFQTSDPQPARARHPNNAPTPAGLVAMTPRTSSPRRRVKSSPCPEKTADRPRRRFPASFETGPRRLSTAYPSPLAFSPSVTRWT